MRADKLLRSAKQPRFRSVYPPPLNLLRPCVNPDIPHSQSLPQPLDTPAIGMSTTTPASGKPEAPVPPGFVKTGEKVRDMLHTLDYIGSVEFNLARMLTSP